MQGDNASPGSWGDLGANFVTRGLSVAGEGGPSEVLGAAEVVSYLTTGTDLGDNAWKWAQKNWYLQKPYSPMPIIMIK